MGLVYISLFSDDEVRKTGHTKLGRASSRHFNVNPVRYKDIPNRIIAFNEKKRHMFLEDLKFRLKIPRNYEVVGNAKRDNLIEVERLGLNKYSNQGIASIDLIDRVDLVIASMCAINLSDVQKRLTPSLIELGKSIAEFNDTDWDLTELISTFPELLVTIQKYQEDGESFSKAFVLRYLEVLHEIMGYVFCSLQNMFDFDFVLFSYSFHEMIISSPNLTGVVDGIMIKYKRGSAFVPIKMQPYRFYVG